MREWNGAARFPGGKKISLKQGIAHLQGFRELFLSLDFFGQHANSLFHVSRRERMLLRGRSKPKIDFNEIGDFNQRFPIDFVLKIVQGQKISPVFQSAAGFQDFRVRHDGFQEFDDHDARWKQGHIILQQEIAGAIDERALSVGQPLQADEE